MSNDAIAIVGFVALFALMLLRVPVGMAMGLVGVAGFSYLVNGAAALKIIGHTSMRADGLGLPNRSRHRPRLRCLSIPREAR